MRSVPTSELDDALVAHVWENIGPAAPLLAASGRFGDGASGARR